LSIRKRFNELEDAFSEMDRIGVGALSVFESPMITAEGRRIAHLALRHRIPAIFPDRSFLEAGGLMSYGSSRSDAVRLAGVYTGRILKGETPADLPVQQATKVELYINLKAAKALGLTVPLSLLGRADEVIE